MTVGEVWAQLLANWPTVVGTLVLSIGGSIGAAWIAGSSTRAAASKPSRESARVALWGFERALRDAASEEESREIRDGTEIFTTTTPDDLAQARKAAYPYITYLKRRDRKHLRANWIDEWDPRVDPLARSHAMFKRAEALEQALARVFKT